MEARNLASVGLSLMLAVNCFMPCYTLAYADEQTDGGVSHEQLRENKQKRAGDGQAHQGSDLQGVLRHEASGEASPGSELSPSAGAGRIRPFAHVLVEASYSLVDSLIRFASARAYADESQEVESVPKEEQEEIAGDAGGLEFPSGVSESDSDATDGGAAAEGHGDYLGASEETGEDSSGLDGGLDVNGNFFELVLSFLEDITYLLGEIADYYRSGFVSGAGGGVVALAGYGGSLTGGFGGAFSGGSGVGKVANTTDSVDAFTAAWGWGYGGTAVFYKTSPAGWLQQLRNAQISAWGQNYSSTPDYNSNSPAGWLRNLRDRSAALSPGGSTWSFTDFLNGIYQLDRAQWGYGYGGTAVIIGNSPAGWLQQIRDAQKSAWGNNYADTPNYNANSPAGWLRAVMDYSLSSKNGIQLLIADQKSAWGNNYASTPNYNANSPAGWLRDVATYTNQARRYLVHHDPVDDVDYSIAAYGSLINQKVNIVRGILDSVTVGPEGGRVSLYNIGNSIETIKNETRDLDNLLEDSNTWLGSIDERVTALDALGVRLANISLTADEIRKDVNSSLQWHETLHGDLSMLRHGVADLLPGYADWTLWDFLQGLYIDLGNVVDLLKGLQQTLTAWGNRWDSQDLYLMEWAKRWDALDKGGSWSESDKGALFAKLDGISDRLSVEAGQTILDALLGEVKPQYINDQLTIVKEVARNRFPFCIPAMMQQMLGLMQSEAQVPHWEFDFFGSPLVLDLGDLDGFASVTRWASCFMLFLALLANTKRFIFDLGGGGK